MTYLRFSPSDYLAICRVCRTLNLAHQPSEKLKRHIAGSLAAKHPDLAARIEGLQGKELLVLHHHLLEQQQPRNQHGLTARELWMLAEAFGPLLFNARFTLPLKRTLVQKFEDSFPELAAKLDLMSPNEFEKVCDQVQERTKRDA
jgi:hypothetical protein